MINERIAAAERGALGADSGTAPSADGGEGNVRADGGTTSETNTMSGI